MGANHRVAELWEDRKSERRMDGDKAAFEAKVPGYGFRVYAVAPVSPP